MKSFPRFLEFIKNSSSLFDLQQDRDVGREMPFWYQKIYFIICVIQCVNFKHHSLSSSQSAKSCLQKRSARGINKLGLKKAICAIVRAEL